MNLVWRNLWTCVAHKLRIWACLLLLSVILCPWTKVLAWKFTMLMCRSYGRSRETANFRRNRKKWWWRKFQTCRKEGSMILILWFMKCMCLWNGVRCRFVEIHHPQNAKPNCIINVFNDNAISHFKNILKQTKTNPLTYFQRSPMSVKFSWVVSSDRKEKQKNPIRTVCSVFMEAHFYCKQ